MKDLRYLSQRQVATIVAALRFFTRNYEEGEQPPIAVRDMATGNGTLRPLTRSEVDDLAGFLEQD